MSFLASLSTRRLPRALHLAAVKPKQKHRLIYPPTCPALELGRVTGEYRCVRMCVSEVSEV